MISKKAIQQIEDQNASIETKFWNRIPVPIRNKELLCRYGIETRLIDETTILLFGGAKSTKTSKSALFNIIDNQISELQTNSEAPSNRFYYGMLDSGDGVTLMFGGKDDTSSSNVLSDFWMFKTNKYNKSIKYIKYATKSDNFDMIFAWREGFSIHHSSTLNRPIIIGGGFGNNQHSQALLLLPTVI